MKRLQLCVLAALLCCTTYSQSANDHIGHIHIISPESNTAFSFFTATPSNGQTILRWAVPSILNGDFFIIEKSSDALHFEVLAVTDASAVIDSVYMATDNSVGNSTVSYRIRISGKDDRQVYSKTITVNSVLEADFKFYPNPVDKLLIVRSFHPLNLQVMDSDGVVKFIQDIDSGMQIVNVSALQKGIYTLRVTDKATNAVISEQLVKNN